MDRNRILNAAITVLLASIVIALLPAFYFSKRALDAAGAAGSASIDRIERQVRQAWLHQPVNPEACEAGLAKAHGAAVQALKTAVESRYSLGEDFRVFDSYTDPALFTAQVATGRKRAGGGQQGRGLVRGEELLPIVAREERAFWKALNRSSEPYGIWLIYSLLTGGGAFGLFWLKGAPGRRIERARQVETRLEAQRAALRANPLRYHHCCPRCGWLGRLRPAEGGPSGAGGAVAVAGGTAITGLGLVGIIGGSVLVLAGIPLLLVFGLGIIPIGVGIVFIVLGSTATTAGVSVGVAGAESASRASEVRQAMAEAPRACPVCRTPGLIPASSPVALGMMQCNPLMAAAASAAIGEVLRTLDVVSPPFEVVVPPPLPCGE